MGERAYPGYLRQVELAPNEAAGVVDPESYPFSVAGLRGFESAEIHPRVTFFVGENGSGKSTLLEGLAVAMGVNPEGGSKNMQFATRESHSVLGHHLRLSWTPGLRPDDVFFLRAESLFNVATEIERLGVQDAYGGASLHEQSHGESFLTLLEHRFRGWGLYLLDEPEAALSPQRQLAALRRMHQLVVERSQFIVCTHSPILMAYPDAWIYEMGEEGMRRVEYEETEHYRVMRSFMARREQVLRMVLEE